MRLNLEQIDFLFVVYLGGVSNHGYLSDWDWNIGTSFHCTGKGAATPGILLKAAVQSETKRGKKERAEQKKLLAHTSDQGKQEPLSDALEGNSHLASRGASNVL